jgi:hypothetical protein
LAKTSTEKNAMNVENEIATMTDKFAVYLRIQNSGKTNMFAVGNVVALSLGELTKADCLDIMANYDAYLQEFGE